MAEETAHLIVKADTTQVENASRKLGDFATQGKKAESSADAVTAASARLAKAAGVVGAAIAAVNTALSATRTYTEFSRAMTNVSTLIEGTADQMKALEAASISLGSRYGKMPVEQARTFYQVISSGITDVNKATDLLDSANKLSVAGFADLFATADSMTSIMNAYGDSIKSTADLSDVLFVGTLAGKTTINELSSSLGRVAPIAKELNVGIDELVGSIAALTLGGISTSEAITGVRAILAAVAKPSAEATKLAKALGLEFDTTALKTKGLSGFLEDLKQKTGGSEQALGVLFGGIEAIIPAMALAGEAGVKFNGIMKQMEDRAGATQTAFEKMEQSPGFKLDRLMANISAAGIKLGDILATVLLPILEKVSFAFNKLFGSSMPLSAIDKQKQAIVSMTKELESMNNRINIPVIGELIFDKKKADQLSQSIEDSIADLKKLENEESKTSKTEAVRNQTITKTINLQELMGKGQKSLTNDTKSYNIEVYKLKESEKELAGARDIEYQKLKRHESLLNEAKQLTEQTRTAQEKYNDTINRYNALRPHITAETYSRAVANATNELERSRTEVNKFDQASKQSSENWRNAWSNMEQTGRMAFTQFAAHGVSAMESIGQSLKLAVFDLLYQLTVRKWIINIGTSIEGSMFGTMAGNAVNGGGTNIFAGGFGKGVTGLIGRGGSMLPGAAGTFFGGMAGAGAGVFSAAGGAGTAFIGGPGTALGGTGMGGIASMGARLGAGLSAAAGPMMAAYAATQLFKGLAGDKQIGGGFGKFVDKISNIPILGDMLPIAPLLKALFGRGPLKQKETTLTGDIGLGGFESGMLQTTFKAKGGLFRSNKTDFARVDAITGEIWTDNQKQLGQFAKDLSKAAKDIFSAFNETAKQSSKLLNDTAKDLGLSNDALKDFNYQIKLVSEKGKGLTEEQIADEIESMSTAMAEKLIPNIHDFTKAGEAAIDAISRLHSEFLAIDNAARVLGMTLKDSSDYVKQMGFELRTSFIDAAGGVESFNSKMSFVSENFLTTEQRFAMGLETLNDQLTKAGVPLDTTKESFYQLLRVAAAAGDAVKFGGLLDIAPLFVEIRNSQDEMRIAAEELRKAEIEAANIHINKWIDEREAAALAIEEQRKIGIANELNLSYALLQRSVDAEKLKLTNDYNAAIKTSEERIKGVVDAIAELSDISKLLKTSINSITFTDISAARSQVAAAIASKDFSSPALRDAITALSQKGTGFASKLDEQRYAAQNLTLLRSLDDVADAELLLQKRSLSALENAEKILKDNYDAEIKRLDGILENAKSQIDALNRIDNSVVSVADAIARLASAVIAAQSIAPMRNEVVTISPSVAAAPVYDSPMRNWNPNAITISPSVSSAPVYDTPLPIAKFELGGKVPRTGIAMIHENERVLTSKQDASLEKNLEEMKTAIEVLTITQNKMNRRFDKWDNEGLPDTRVA